jgi:hypothetical protein
VSKQVTGAAPSARRAHGKRTVMRSMGSPGWNELGPFSHMKPSSFLTVLMLPPMRALDSVTRNVSATPFFLSTWSSHTTRAQSSASLAQQQTPWH